MNSIVRTKSLKQGLEKGLLENGLHYRLGCMIVSPEVCQFLIFIVNYSSWSKNPDPHQICSYRKEVNLQFGLDRNQFKPWNF